ncbi:MAG: hypothetical protein QM753_16170 [Thermomicrobiales bacterium]
MLALIVPDRGISTRVDSLPLIVSITGPGVRVGVGGVDVMETIRQVVVATPPAPGALHPWKLIDVPASDDRPSAEMTQGLLGLKPAEFVHVVSEKNLMMPSEMAAVIVPVGSR